MNGLGSRSFFLVEAIDADLRVDDGAEEDILQAGAGQLGEEALWTCFRKVESSPDVKGEPDDEAEAIYEGV